MANREAAYDPQFGFTSYDGTITDPGDDGALPVASGSCAIVTAGAEIRTLAIPTRSGMEITLFFQTDGGDAVITVASAINVVGNNTITFAAAGDSITLRSVYTGTAWAWRVAWNDITGADSGGTSDIGAGLSTV